MTMTTPQEPLESPKVDPQLMAEIQARMGAVNGNGNKGATSPKEESVLRRLSSIPVEEMKWHYYPWIPLTGLAGLAGKPGSGKSTVFCMEVANLTTGGYGRDPIDVIYFAKEDETAVYKARLIAAGADIDRVWIMGMKATFADGTPYERDLNFKRDLDQLGHDLRANPEIKAVYLDPANSYMGIDEHKDTHTMIQQELFRLKHFAATHQVLVRLMKHTKKDQGIAIPGEDSIYGVQAWTEVARIFSILVRLDPLLKEKLNIDPEDPITALLTRGKHNYAPHDLPARGIRIEERYVTVDGTAFEKAVTVAVDMGEREVTSDELNEKKSQPIAEARKSNTEGNALRAALLTLILDAPDNALPRKVIHAALKDQHTYTPKTLYNNGKALHITMTDTIKDTKAETIWRLPAEWVKTYRDEREAAGWTEGHPAGGNPQASGPNGTIPI